MKSVAFFSLFVIGLSANSQLWFDVGLKGGGGTGFLNNKNLTSDSRLSVNPGSNYFFGGKIGINYGYYLSIATDFTYGNNSFSFNQAELFGSTTTYKYKIGYSSFNVAPLLRYTKEASYIEFGPEFSLIQNASISDEATAKVDFDVKDKVNDKLKNLVFGFGGYIVGNEIVALQMGIRFHYSLSNLTSDTWEASRFPLENYTDLNGGVSTNPFMVQLHLELNFSLGQIARSSSKCGKRIAFLSF